MTNLSTSTYVDEMTALNELVGALDPKKFYLPESNEISRSKVLAFTSFLNSLFETTHRLTEELSPVLGKTARSLNQRLLDTSSELSGTQSQLDELDSTLKEIEMNNLQLSEDRENLNTRLAALSSLRETEQQWRADSKELADSCELLKCEVEENLSGSIEQYSASDIAKVDLNLSSYSTVITKLVPQLIKAYQLESNAIFAEVILDQKTVKAMEDFNSNFTEELKFVDQGLAELRQRLSEVEAFLAKMILKADADYER